MLTTKQRVGALALSIALLASCSKEVQQPVTEGEILLANAELSVSYDKDVLSKNISMVNSPIDFLRPGGASSLRASGQRGSSFVQQRVANYQPSATGTPIAGGNAVTIDNANTVLVVEAGQTFSGRVNFNAGGKLIVLGTFTGSTDLHGNGTLEVGKGATFTPSSFNVNGAQSVINNYGLIEVTNGSTQGIWNNYANVLFKNAINLNSGSQFTNYCLVEFTGKVDVNSVLRNESHVVFNNGFHINGNGHLLNVDGSYTEIKGGTVSVDGRIEGGTNSVSRIDISNTTIQHLNASPAVTGKLDINGTGVSLANLQGKVGADITFDQNAYIAENGCTPQKGIAPNGGGNNGGTVCNENALAFELLATVAAPSVNNHDLSATDVRIQNGFAYVSYHTNDALTGTSHPGGALQVFNVQTPATPTIVNEVKFFNSEFNGVEATPDQLIASGQNKNGSVIATLPLTQGQFAVTALDQIQFYGLPSASAKNSVWFNNQIWVATGATGGGLFSMTGNNTTGYNAAVSIAAKTGAKYVAKNDTYKAFFAVEADHAFLTIANVDGTGAREYTYPSLKQTVVDGKNGLAMDDNFAYIALSEQGVAKIDLATGNLVAHFVPNTYRVEGISIFKEKGYTNALAVDQCYLYLANGADGVIVLNKASFRVVGHFKLAGGSTNFVAAKDGLIFVATGRGGLNIIQVK